MHHLLNAILTLLGLTALNSVRHTTIPFFKRYFFVPARKSKTMALQIGGLPIAFSMFITLLVYYFRGDIENQEIQTLLVVFLVSSVFISGIGYLDDKIELRPVYKLLGQMFVCFAFSFISSLVLENYYYSILTFLGLFIFSMAVMNGSNLIDGVDTLCLKIAAINFSTYYTLATIYQLEITKQISLIGLVPMICFWFFNREPSKIHLGEIGSSLLGYYYILISMVMFHEHLYGTLGGKLPIIVSCALPLLLPTTELGFTFLRRIINGKSPFVGDRLHVHHLLLNHFKFSPTKTANTISLIYLIDMAGTCYFIALSKPLWAVGFSLIFKFTLYAYIAVKFWLKPVHIEVISPRFIFNSLRKKDVTVINFKLVDKIDFQVISEEDSDKKKTKPVNAWRLPINYYKRNV